MISLIHVEKIQKVLNALEPDARVESEIIVPSDQSRREVARALIVLEDSYAAVYIGLTAGLSLEAIQRNHQEVLATLYAEQLAKES